MKFAKFVTLLALLATPATALAGGDNPAQPPMQIKLDEFKLNTTVLEFPTGLRFLIQEDHSHPIVTIYKYVGHGFNDDPEGAEETAHFVEHVWFRSVHGDMPPIMFVIQDLGTMFNATTAADRTDYRTTANVKYLPIMLKLESLRMTDFYRGVTEEQITVEREVIRNEWRRRNEQSTALLFDYMGEALYPEGHPYSRRSTHETLDNINLKVLQDYVDTNYKPEDTTITIVGDFKTDELISMLLENFDLSLLHPKLTEDFVNDEGNAEYMGKLMDYRLKPGVEAPAEGDQEAWAKLQENPSNWRLFLRNPDNVDDPGDVGWFVYNYEQEGPLPPRIPPKSQRPAPPPVGIGGTEPQRREGPVEKQTVLVGWSLPAGYYDDHFALRMLGNVATGYVQRGMSINFGKDVVWKEAGCFSQPGLHATTLLCGVEVNNTKLDPVNVAEKVIDQMSVITNPDNARMFDLQFSRSKQESLKSQLESVDLVAAVFGSRAEYIGEYGHWTGDPAYYARAFKQINAVQGQQLGQLAHEYLTRDRAAILIVDPLKAEDIDVSSNSSSYGGASEGDAVIEASDDLSLATRDAIADAYAKPELDGLTDMKLDNGLRVVIMPHGEAPKVHAQLILGGGSATEPLGIHNFTARYAKSAGHDPLRIAATPYYVYSPSFLGLSEPEAYPISFRPNAESWGLGMTGPSGNLDGMLWILRQELETVTPYTSGKGSWFKSRYKRLKGQWFDTAWHQRKMQNDQLFPGEPRYRGTTWEDIEAQEDWGNDEIQSYLDDHLHPENATLVIVGKVTKEQALAQAKKYFGGWQANPGSAKKGRPELTMPKAPEAASRTVIFDDEKRTQTQTTFACRLNSKGDDDREAVRILGSMMGNQTLANLRVKEGLAYSPGAFAFTQADGSAMLIFSSLAINKGVGRTVEFFRHAVERVEEGDIDPAEVKLHQIRINRSGGVGNQSVEQMADMMVSAVEAERSWDYLANSGERIADVTPEDLTRLVEGCLDHAIVTMEGPKDVITEQLDEKGFEYEIYDYEKAGDELLWKYDPKAAKKKQKKKDKAEKKKKKNGEDEESTEDDSTADASEE